MHTEEEAEAVGEAIRLNLTMAAGVRLLALLRIHLDHLEDIVPIPHRLEARVDIDLLRLHKEATVVRVKDKGKEDIRTTQAGVGVDCVIF